MKVRRRFSKRCKELRRAAGLSQMAVARHSDFGLSHYQRIERGELDPKLSTLFRLAEVYGVTIVDLVTGL
jgi:transcriptional regulator with XRE-family HTH domain